jgi:hypothetical protein
VTDGARSGALDTCGPLDQTASNALRFLYPEHDPGPPPCGLSSSRGVEMARPRQHVCAEPGCPEIGRTPCRASWPPPAASAPAPTSDPAPTTQHAELAGKPGATTRRTTGSASAGLRVWPEEACTATLRSA